MVDHFQAIEELSDSEADFKMKQLVGDMDIPVRNFAGV
jgi:hypothetical protein